MRKEIQDWMNKKMTAEKAELKKLGLSYYDSVIREFAKYADCSLQETEKEAKNEGIDFVLDDRMLDDQYQCWLEDYATEMEEAA